MSVFGRDQGTQAGIRWVLDLEEFPVSGEPPKDTSFPECGDGCSVAEHRHGDTPSGDGSVMADIKAGLVKLADDLAGGTGHWGKTAEWYEKEVLVTLAELVDGTEFDDYPEVRAMLQQQAQVCEDQQKLLMETSEKTREMAARR